MALADPIAESIFQGRLLPELGAFGAAVEQPRFIVLGGQQGSGKSSFELAELRGQTIQFINGDVIDTYVPGTELLDENGTRRVPEEMNRQSAEWIWRLLKRAIKARYHVVFEVAFPRFVLPFVQLARQQRYYTELIVLAVNRHVSLASMLDRHRRNPVQWVIRERDHAHACGSWPLYLIEAENKGYYDRVRLVERGGRDVYSNHIALRDGAIGWYHRPEAYERLLLHRNARPSAAVARWLEDTWEMLAADSRHARAFVDARAQAEARDAALVFAKSTVSFARSLEQEVEGARAAASRYDCPNFEQLSADLMRTVATRVSASAERPLAGIAE